jgi:P27 family predicted phage terminase small subunit
MTARKPPSTRQPAGTGTHDAPEPDAGIVRRPEPPRHLGDETKSAWDAFWATPQLAQRVGEADLDALRRLYQFYEIYLQSIDKFMAEPYVEGERGKLVTHPAWNVANAVSRQIMPLERQFGITPKARYELGITLTNTKGGPEGQTPMDFTDDDQDDS